MRILDIRVDEIDMAAAVDFLAAAINAYKDDGRLRSVITLNPEGLYLATQDSAFKDIIESADLVTADGTGLLWAAYHVGQPLPERVTGIDLLGEACKRAAREGWRVYLLGAKPGIADKAALQLTQNYPGLHICGRHHGYFSGQEETVLTKIADAAPDILFVALGLPAQERFIAAYRHSLKTAVAIGVGGSLDVLAGHIKRAPKKMRRLRLEWLWRLLLQPSRLPRLLVIPKFMIKVIKYAKKV